MESLLGQGGMSQVYLAEDQKLKGKMWAVKEVLPVEQDGASFLEEAEMLARLHHPQLPQLVDYLITEDGTGFLVMDYIQGPTLQDLFEEKGRELPTAKVVQIAFQLCDILHYLHTFQPRPIIYRDLKPSNIMLNEQSQVRLIDFGVARHFTQGKQTDTMQMGTIGFAAPEQFMGLQTDARSDLYSLGAMLYYLLTGGQYAYLTNKSLDQLNPELPETLTSTIRLLLQENPQHRCQSAMEVKMRLRSIYPDPAHTTDYQKHSNPMPQQDKLIVVGGLFAGVGSTFLAVTIARILNALQIPNALVEQPTIEPDLYMLLYGDLKAPKNYNFAAHSMRVQDQSLASSPWDKGHSTWFPTHPDGFHEDWQPADSFKLLHMIKKPIVLWDISTQWEHPSVQELCHSADDIIVVLDASPGKCNRSSSRANFNRFNSYQQRGKKVHYIANGNMQDHFHKEWITSLPASPLCTMPELPRGEVMRAVWKGECIQDRPEVLKQLMTALSPLLKELLPESCLLVNEGKRAKNSLFSKLKKISNR
ncbi:serine/threonine-protein kinase [Paenibacillus chondroitinus]|uniref:non-specific serine/threonine protein kinase n=1 Tax=Paenibacillus chondroitinus TaxID=59842 RepID=A0ABU6DN06_9BACL|nr:MULTISPECIES: serine/threonine-protein kinase [Paenibacillus]MEB4799151.1 serine/threonine-protein kinase [Paenibacillus chondroitinus]